MTSHELIPASAPRPPTEQAGQTEQAGRTGQPTRGGRGGRAGRGDGTGPGHRRAGRRWVREAVVLGGPALVAVALGWTHRWVGDDGMIYARTVRQLLAGHGPVFNVGERAEASTGTLWQWLIAGGGYLSGADPSVVAVGLGLLLTGMGYVLAVAAARKAVRPLSAAPLLPLGMLVLLAVKADWDYTTSGLENGLTTGWIAGSWWLLVSARRPGDDRPRGRHRGGHRARADRTFRGRRSDRTTSGGRFRRTRQVAAAAPGHRGDLRPGDHAAAFVIGLGPLVRPDLALVTLVFLATLGWMLRPGAFGALRMLGAACALPLAYEVFRAGYYGVLVPLPGLTKEASDAVWTRGLAYLGNFADPYRLWAPLLLLATLAAFGRCRPAMRPELLAPPIAGLLSWLYVCRVGGDFMHGRLLVPGLLLLMLPVCAVPLSRPVGVVAGALVVWAVCCALLWRPVSSTGNPYLILDEQRGYAAFTHDPHPISEAVHARRRKPFLPAVRAAEASEASGRPTLLLVVSGDRRIVSLPLAHRFGHRTAGSYELLGYNGIVMPLRDTSVDPLGLAYPLAAHQGRAARRTAGRSGHEKPLDPAWIMADYTDPGTPVPRGVDPARVLAARHALTCGPLAELQSSVRAPLTPGRFLDNLLGAWTRTAFRYPDDPRHAERALCHD
ncbi:hypothetical protein [Streptomyces sp. NBC_01190]|uniref:hypothetical protein n=1 Tax=Streptomyces sp. NBC_01190 TaxID=2903767 RepID=UPI0038630F6A|nr:hypothetical protein OG519_11660 [Streptomyces sp. NBC_01190]